MAGVDSLIATNRAKKMPCFCDRTGGAELLERRFRAGAALERLRCNACSLVFRRIWTRG